MMEVRALTPDFGAEVTELDLTRPDTALAETCFALFDAHALCVFRPSGLDDASHVAFSRQFGELENAPLAPGLPLRFSLPELFDAGNLDRDGSIRMDERRRLFNKGNRQWHTDSSFRVERSSYSMLLAHAIPPEGGDTDFADMRAAWAALPEATKARIEGLSAVHSIWHSRKLAGYPEPTEAELTLIPSATQPLVLAHPRTGVKALYLARHASHIVGMDPAESDALLEELIAFATQPRFTYTHVWQPGDLVVWDNRATMHRATEFDDARYPRDMRRTTVRDRPLGSVAAA